MSNSFQALMAYDDYEIKKETPEFKERMHREALSKRQHMQQCPVCNKYETFITNVHCVKEHGMTKKEVESIHGKILTVAQAKRQKREMEEK